MRISVSVTDYSWHGGAPELACRLARMARAADDAGLDTLWVADHTTLDVLSGGLAGHRRRLPDGSETIARKRTVLARHCETVGRDFDSIEKTVSTRLEPGESPDAFAARCEDLSALGIEHAVVITSGPWTDEAIATLADAQGGGSG